jgi:hypothetical protein
VKVAKIAQDAVTRTWALEKCGMKKMRKAIQLSSSCTVCLLRYTKIGLKDITITIGGRTVDAGIIMHML